MLPGVIISVTVQDASQALNGNHKFYISTHTTNAGWGELTDVCTNVSVGNFQSMARALVAPKMGILSRCKICSDRSRFRFFL